MQRVFLPARDAEQWKELLADPEHEWRPGRAAPALAHAWQDAQGFPPSVDAMLRASPLFEAIEPLLILPGHAVPLPDEGHPVRLDAWVLARSGAELVSIAVEGRGSESFGPTLGERREEGAPDDAERLAAAVGLEPPLPLATSHRLVQRTACAVAEAERFTALHAVLLVHSFGPDSGPDAAGLGDFRRLAALFGQEAEPGALVSIGRPGVSLHMGWARG